MRHITVTRPTTFYVLTGGFPAVRAVKTNLVWDSTSPLEVTLHLFVARDRVCEWIIGRDLLTEGLTQRAGLGDVIIAPCRNVKGYVEIHLTVPTGSAKLRVEHTELHKFLTETWKYVTPDTDLPLVPDTAIAEFIEGAST